MSFLIVLLAEELPHGLDCVCVSGLFVVPKPGYAREAESKARFILRAGLDLIEQHFDDDLRLYEDGATVTTGLQRQQTLRHLLEFLVSQTFEGLAHLNEGAVLLISGGQVVVAQPAMAAAVAPVRGDDDQLKREGALDFEPGLAPHAGMVWTVQVLDDQPLVPFTVGLLCESLSFRNIVN